MFEKVNPSHPDKIADRIAGSIVDLAYEEDSRPKIAVEVLIGHNKCLIIIETNVDLDNKQIEDNVRRISQNDNINIEIVKAFQDKILYLNQTDEEMKCGDNGIFSGRPVTSEQQRLTELVSRIYGKVPFDGKYIIDESEKQIIGCQSHIITSQLDNFIWDSNVEPSFYDYQIQTNPLGYWTGGTDVDSGATNRKLGSDMGDAVTGGGLHGKDLSKADVTLNIYAHLKANELGRPINLKCAIGDKEIDGKKYDELVEIAYAYIKSIGGFEKFAEWGLIRPKIYDMMSYA